MARYGTVAVKQRAVKLGTLIRIETSGTQVVELDEGGEATLSPFPHREVIAFGAQVGDRIRMEYRDHAHGQGRWVGRMVVGQ